jgi:hypothetical protein
MSTPQIESFSFGHIVIDGRAYDQDVIILPDHVLGDWWRKEGHVLHPDDLETVFEIAPEILIVGKGAQARMRVAAKTRQALDAAGIELIAQPTEEACRTYGTLCDERTTAAALHLTC